MKSAGQFRRKAKNRIWNSKALAVFALKMTDAFALEVKKNLPFFRLMKYNEDKLYLEMISLQIAEVEVRKIYE